MDEMDIVRKITHLVYTHRRDAAFTGQKQPNVKHRDIMMLDAIIKMGDLVKMSDISAYFQITPAAVSQCIKNFEKKGWVEPVSYTHLLWECRIVKNSAFAIS